MADLQNILIACTVAMTLAIGTCFIKLDYLSQLDFRDCIVFLGIGLVGIGAWMVYPAAGFITSGALLVWIGRPR